MSPLVDLKCEACRNDEPCVTGAESLDLLKEIPDWRIVQREGVQRLERVYTFPDFAQAIRFTDQVAFLAEEIGHHPAILTEWGRVTVHWWTHKIKGLHPNDFIMAAKTDGIYEIRTDGS
ncbi:MAG: 4a-hydroxytetrahydrobiopterin dehydratase [Phycisphaerae bacterium]|nr:4a-hydroxytetrahydrobiopterin dehydratase [Phycisphaerae bacterium]